MIRFFYFFVALAVSRPIFAQTLETDRLALIDLYNATNGPNWTNKTGWNAPGTPGNNPCGWYGVSCWGERVIFLDLHNNNLAGNIPVSIGNLTNLVSLGLNNNQLSDSIPASIGNLTNLIFLALNDNQLTGNIPVSIGNLTNLTNLSVQNNQLAGSIPNTLGSASKLKYIWAYNNKLTSELPIEIGNLIDLEVLNIYSNQLTGSIPASIGNLTKLKTLWLSGNQLTGNIPTSIGSLNQLTDLYLDGNQLTGNFNLSGIPVSARVILQNNKFTFDGIESNASLIDYYSWQANIPITNTAGVLSVNAGGTLANNTYRWYKRNPTALVATNVGNANYTPNVAGTYFVQVSNSIATGLTLTSDDITLNLPSFTTHPSSITVCPGIGTSFTISATNALSYQWQLKIGTTDFVNLSEGGVYANVTSNTLTISNVAGLNGNQYRCVATGTGGSTNSNAATLTVGTATETRTLQSPEDDITIASPTKNALHITATNKIRATGTVIYQGAQSVVLNPGFEAQTGSIFTAQIGGCN